MFFSIFVIIIMSMYCKTENLFTMWMKFSKNKYKCKYKAHIVIEMKIDSEAIIILLYFTEQTKTMHSEYMKQVWVLYLQHNV